MKHSKKLTFLPVRRFEENLSTGLSTLFFLGVLVDLLALFSQSDIINGGIFTAEQNTTADYISASSELLVGFSLAGIAFLLGHITCRVGKRSFRWRKVSWLSSILGSTLACASLCSKVGLFYFTDEDSDLFSFFDGASTLFWMISLLAYFLVLVMMRGLSTDRLYHLANRALVFSILLLLFVGGFLLPILLFNLSLTVYLVVALVYVLLLSVLAMTWRKILSSASCTPEEEESEDKRAKGSSYEAYT